VPRTADRFPGEREDEGIILFDQGPGGLAGGDPTVAGGIRYVTDRFKLLDVLGVFNARPVYVSPSSNPTITSDDASGYSVGMFWLNVATGGVYVCKDNTTGAAVWVTFVAPAPTEPGQIQVSYDGINPVWGVPVVSADDGWLANAHAELLVEGLEP
jgi:hypothetical protein